jgi:hypothetical protein
MLGFTNSRLICRPRHNQSIPTLSDLISCATIAATTFVAQRLVSFFFGCGICGAGKRDLGLRKVVRT